MGMNALESHDFEELELSLSTKHEQKHLHGLGWRTNSSHNHVFVCLTVCQHKNTITGEAI